MLWNFSLTELSSGNNSPPGSVSTQAKCLACVMHQADASVQLQVRRNPPSGSRLKMALDCPRWLTDTALKNMKTSKILFYNVRPSCFKVPANTGLQKLDTLVVFYFLSNLQFEFLETKTVMANHHWLFNELSAGIPICCWKVQNKPKIETKKGRKSSLSLIQYALVIAHPKTQSS